MNPPVNIITTPTDIIENASGESYSHYDIVTGTSRDRSKLSISNVNSQFHLQILIKSFVFRWAGFHNLCGKTTIEFPSVPSRDDQGST